MIRWVERRFDFDFPVELADVLVERLRGMPARIVRRLDGLPADVLTAHPEGAWSIKMHAAHLADLDVLFLTRLDDFDAGRALTPADMTNRATEEANHDAATVEDIVARVRNHRSRVVARIEGLDEAAFARVSRHPRLDTPMRFVDLLYFKAEHDDHHLAGITRNLSRLGVPGLGV